MRYGLGPAVALAFFGILFAACPPQPPSPPGPLPPAPIFRLASNGPDYKIPCQPCSEFGGPTECANLGSFYVFFDAPAGRTIQTAKVTISWEERTLAGTPNKEHTGAVPSGDILSPTSMECGNKGWGVHIQPKAVLTGFRPNAGDNLVVVKVVVQYSGETKESLPLSRNVHFLG